jgi:hypothetical protein
MGIDWIEVDRDRFSVGALVNTVKKTSKAGNFLAS